MHRPEQASARRRAPTALASAVWDERDLAGTGAEAPAATGGVVVPSRPEEPLNVLIVSQPVDFGVAVYVRQLTEAAVAAGHNVTVVSPGPRKGPLSGWVERLGARHEILDMARQPAPRDLRDVWTLRRLARGRDVVHLHSSKAAALGRMAVATMAGPRPAVVVTPHYWSWLVGGRLARLYRWIERVLAGRCDAIVAVSKREAEEGRLVLGARRNIMLIHNGVDPRRFRPDGVRADRKLEAPLITCVGRLSTQKGQDVAVRALALTRNASARLRLVGRDYPAGERERLETLAMSIGVADRIEWRGQVPDAAPELRAADLVIAPSRWEGMSLVFLEAMACGAAIIASDVSGSEVLDGVGVIVPSDDPRALAEAIDELLSDEPRRRRLGEAARERSGSYDLASAMRRNIDLWSTLASGRTRSRPRRVFGRR